MEQQDNLKIATPIKKFTQKSVRIRIPFWCFVLALIIIISIIATVIYDITRSEPEPITIREISLEEIINISELSTVSFVYKGISDGRNERNPDRIDYYVSYTAEVRAGIDFKNIQTAVNDAEKTVYITLPQVTINNISVDPNSLDFMFMNEKANTADTIQKALAICNNDVSRSCEPQNATTIYELAKENAVNAVKALIEPLLNQLEEPYTLIIE